MSIYQPCSLGGRSGYLGGIVNMSHISSSIKYSGLESSNIDKLSPIHMMKTSVEDNLTGRQCQRKITSKEYYLHKNPTSQEDDFKRRPHKKRTPKEENLTGK